MIYDELAAALQLALAQPLRIDDVLIVQADQIAVVENGRITELGTHAELIARNGAYAALWRVQTGAAA